MVSIIIPCFNVAKTLPKTIESVLRQTDSKWEIIAINDGSTDQTWDVLQKYSKLDTRIKIFDKTNGGVSSARNMGIIEATGNWVYFLDGDDVISDKLIEEIHSLPQNTELTIFNFTKESPIKRIDYKIKSITNILDDFLLNIETIHNSSFAVKRQTLTEKKILFNEDTAYGEDREFIARCLSEVNVISHIPKTLFHYIIRNDSVMAQQFYGEKRFSSILAGERIYKSLIGTKHEKAALIALQFTILRHLKLYGKFNDKDMAYLGKLNAYLISYLYQFNWGGMSKMGIYVTIGSLVAKNKKLLNRFLLLM